MEHLLECKDVCMYFGGVHAVDKVNMHVNSGEILGIIGPNGSGKTTLFNVLTGIYKPTSGRVRLNGRDITGAAPHVVAELGIRRTFQNLRLFNALTVRENVLVGAHATLNASLWESLTRRPRFREEELETVNRADEILELVGLGGTGDELAGGMAYGQQKRLELARALAGRPELLLLDEPTAGMNPVEAEGLMLLVQRIRQERNIGIVLIEHNMKAMMQTADRIVAMDTGKIIAEGTPEAIQVNPRVVEAYLGEED